MSCWESISVIELGIRNWKPGSGWSIELWRLEWPGIYLMWQVGYICQVRLENQHSTCPSKPCGTAAIYVWNASSAGLIRKVRHLTWFAVNYSATMVGQKRWRGVGMVEGAISAQCSMAKDRHRLMRVVDLLSLILRRSYQFCSGWPGWCCGGIYR